VESLPLIWAEEGRLWTKSTATLHEDWQYRYYTESDSYPVGFSDIHTRCLSYLRGLQWVVNYYTGGPISAEWMYAWTYPPLWSDLEKALCILSDLPSPDPCAYSLKPQEQLALVLPMESWWLIRDVRLKALPSQMPYMWKKPTQFHSLGKRWLWECHPDIPIIVPARLRAALLV
jgi:5'-3' exonuclease